PGEGDCRVPHYEAQHPDRRPSRRAGRVFRHHRWRGFEGRLWAVSNANRDHAEARGQAEAPGVGKGDLVAKVNFTVRGIEVEVDGPEQCSGGIVGGLIAAAVANSAAGGAVGVPKARAAAPVRRSGKAKKAEATVVVSPTAEPEAARSRVEIAIRSTL